jgi:hypothetical protein
MVWLPGIGFYPGLNPLSADVRASPRSHRYSCGCSAWVSWRLLLLLQLSGLNEQREFFRNIFDRGKFGEGFQFPSICWLVWSTALYACGGILRPRLIVGFVPLPRLVFCSTTFAHVAGQQFYQHQWDILLLEAGFATFFATDSAFGKAPIRRAARFLIVWLLFRLIFASGVVKLTSGDPLGRWDGA